MIIPLQRLVSIQTINILFLTIASFNCIFTITTADYSVSTSRLPDAPNPAWMTKVWLRKPLSLVGNVYLGLPLASRLSHPDLQPPRPNIS